MCPRNACLSVDRRMWFRSSERHRSSERRRERSTRWHDMRACRQFCFASAMADMDEALMKALSALDPANAAAAPATEAEAEEEAEAEVEQEGDGAEVNAAEYQLQLDAGGDVPQLQVDAVAEAGEEAAAAAQEEQLGEDGAGVDGGEVVQAAGAVGGDGDAGDAENGEDSAAMDAVRKQQMRCEPIAPGSNPPSPRPPKPHIWSLNAPHTAPRRLSRTAVPPAPARSPTTRSRRSWRMSTR